jgi:hypothetical protein
LKKLKENKKRLTSIDMVHAIMRILLRLASAISEATVGKFLLSIWCFIITGP